MPFFFFFFGPPIPHPRIFRAPCWLGRGRSLLASQAEYTPHPIDRYWEVFKQTAQEVREPYSNTANKRASGGVATPAREAKNRSQPAAKNKWKHLEALSWLPEDKEGEGQGLTGHLWPDGRTFAQAAPSTWQLLSSSPRTQPDSNASHLSKPLAEESPSKGTVPVKIANACLTLATRLVLLFNIVISLS